jgi:hypothetical protein
MNERNHDFAAFSVPADPDIPGTLARVQNLPAGARGVGTRGVGVRVPCPRRVPASSWMTPGVLS